MQQYLIYELEKQLYALPISQVKHLVRVVATLPVAQASPHILGMVDLHGTLIPAVSLRSLMQLAEKEIELSDIMLICQVTDSLCALLVDHVTTTAFCEEVTPKSVPQIPLPDSLAKYVRWKEKMIPVYELGSLLSHVTIV